MIGDLRRDVERCEAKVRRLEEESLQAELDLEAAWKKLKEAEKEAITGPDGNEEEIT